MRDISGRVRVRKLARSGSIFAWLCAQEQKRAGLQRSHGGNAITPYFSYCLSASGLLFSTIAPNLSGSGTRAAPLKTPRKF